MPRTSLPPLLGPAFSVRTARAAGVTPGRLRGRDLEHPFHGMRSVADSEIVADAALDAARTYPRSPEARRIHRRAMEYAVIMSPAAFFSHVTAAVLWDAPLPRSILAQWHAAAIDVSVFWPSRAPRGVGIHGHAVRADLATVRVQSGSGLRLASAATTWAMLGGVLCHPYDLIAVADYFVRAPVSGTRREPLATYEQLSAAVAAGRRQGSARLRLALSRVRQGSASRPETWTRLTLVDAGLPEPVSDYTVRDASGRFLAWVDLAYPQWRIAIEYDGVHHSAGAQRERDVERYAALEAAGWRVIRVTRTMLFETPTVLVTRVRGAIASRR